MASPDWDTLPLTDEQLESSWAPVDLSDALSGVAEPEPSILTRTDGRSLLYEGRIHQLSAEPEAGKGWLACKASAECLRAGGSVAYFDFEATPGEIVNRHQALGVSDAQILERLIYVHPYEPVSSAPELFDDVLRREPALVIFDGITEVLTLHGLGYDNEDIARYLELFPRPAVRTGAAVLVIDHEVKSKENRGRFAIGGQHKLAGVDVALKLEVVEPFGRGRSGSVRVRVTKDRPGHLGSLAVGENREVALMRLSSDLDTGSVSVDLDPPESDQSEFRPTKAMERISEALEGSLMGMTKGEIRLVGGKSQTLDEALQILLREGYVEMRLDGSAHRHHLLRSYQDPSPEEVQK